VSTFLLSGLYYNIALMSWYCKHSAVQLAAEIDECLHTLLSCQWTKSSKEST